MSQEDGEVIDTGTGRGEQHNLLLVVGIWEREAGSWELLGAAGSWELGAGSYWELGAGSWELLGAAGSC